MHSSMDFALNRKPYETDRPSFADGTRAIQQDVGSRRCEKFGAAIADEKQRIVLDTLENYLAEFPHQGGSDRRRRLHHFPVSKTPFVVVYEFDETELRVLFIVPKGADRRRLDPSTVEW